MSIDIFLELIASNGLAIAMMVPLALYFKKLNDNVMDQAREREKSLYAKLELVNETNKELSLSNKDLVRNNAVIANTNAQLCNDMKIELKSIDSKIDEISEIISE